MKIAFDGKRAVKNGTGLGNYSRYVLESLCKHADADDKFVVYSPKGRMNAWMQRIMDTFSPQIRLVINSSVFASVWRTFGVTKDAENDGAEIFHGLSNELPLNIAKSKMKSVVTIHDLIFRKMPECYKFIDRKIYDYKFRKAAENADMVIAVSERTKKDIVELYNIVPAKIKVVYQGCDAQFAKEIGEDEKARVSQKYNLPQRYILNVGSIETRKNALQIVRALKDIDEAISLVIVGRRTKYAAKIDEYVKSNGLDARVTVISGIDFKDLPAVYAQAEVFAYPSFYEGFGIPIVEALNAGVPVIAATGSCLEEAGGASSIYVNPTNDKEMSDAINRVLTDSGLRAKMIADGKVYAKRFSEEQCSREIKEIYESLIK
ncbi:MAG: glycosyltransferase family 4 protein [Paludibacteraceae bacterium]|nr:glycosyltransferase family 4 protein [Paludibacteraceae bacterium]